MIWIFAALLAASSSHVSANTENSEPGSIVVNATDELGNPLHGFTARIVLPYNDGRINFGMDITATKTDGETDDDLARMKHGTGDGDVEMAAEAAARCVDAGQEFEVTVLTPGLVDTKMVFEYATDQVNFVTVAQDYVLEISARDGDGEPASGFRASVAGSDPVIDGSERDMDVTKNGIIYISDDVMDGKAERQVEIAAEFGGMKEQGVFTLSSRVKKPVEFVFGEDSAGGK